MKKRFRFTNDKIRALPPNPPDARGTDLELSDTEVMGLKCLVGKSGCSHYRLKFQLFSILHLYQHLGSHFYFNAECSIEV